MDCSEKLTIISIMPVPSKVVLRDPLRPPPLTVSVAEVSFCHPGYEPPHDLLFKLPRLDQEHASPTKGIHYGTALTACQIVANNALNGYLATDRAGRHRVHGDADSVLTGTRYWFFTADTPAEATSATDKGAGLHAKVPYPVVPSFQDWPFPHQELQDNNASPAGCLWYPPNAAAAGRCIVTQASGVIQGAHLVPGADREWFERNVMSQYGTHHDVDQSANDIDLRSDIHLAFDEHWFAIVPKAGSYAVHLLTAAKISTREFAESFHNRPVLPDAPIPGEAREVPREFLYARFARAVLLLLKPFVAQSAVSRRVARYRVQPPSPSGAEDQIGPRIYVEWLSSDELHRQYGGGGTRSASPSKRKRGGGQEDDEADTIAEESPLPTMDDSLEEDPKRGRSRKRRCWDDGLGDKENEEKERGYGATPPLSLCTSFSSSSRFSPGFGLGRHEEKVLTSQQAYT